MQLLLAHTHTTTVTDPGHVHTFGSGGGADAPYYPSIEGDGNNSRIYTSTTDSTTTGITVVANSTGSSSD
jgi:hypothetical protein